MASISDVAKLAGVAPSTVSLVINNKGYVSKVTRAKVEAAIKELAYVPSEMARNLALSRTNVIGVIVSNLSHPFFGEVVDEIERNLFAMGYNTMVCSTAQKKNAEATFVDMLRRQTMDGIIMGAHTSELSIYDGLKRPIVAFDRYINESIPVIHADHEQGGRMAADALIGKNCRHVVSIHGVAVAKSPAAVHHVVFKERIREAGIKLDVLEMPWQAFSHKDYYEAAQEVFERYPDADGILGSDLAICYCQKIARKLGRRVPDDLKLVAYDGTELTRIASQVITAVVQPIDELAIMAAKKIVAMVSNEVPPEFPVPPMRWQEGETC